MVRGREETPLDAVEALAPDEETVPVVEVEVEEEVPQEEPIPDAVVLKYIGDSPRHVHGGVREYVWTPGSSRPVYPQDAAYLLRVFRKKFVQVEG